MLGARIIMHEFQYIAEVGVRLKLDQAGASGWTELP